MVTIRSLNLGSEFDLTPLLNMTDYLENIPLYVSHTEAKAVEILVGALKVSVARTSELSLLVCILERITDPAPILYYRLCQCFSEQCKMIQLLHWGMERYREPTAGCWTAHTLSFTRL